MALGPHGARASRSQVALGPSGTGAKWHWGQVSGTGAKALGARPRAALGPSGAGAEWRWGQVALGPIDLKGN